MKRILLSITLLFSAASLYGQGTPSEGKDYYLGFLYPSYNTAVPTQSAGYFKIYALVSSFQDNTAYVSYFNADGTETAPTPYMIQARKTTEIPITLSNVQIASDETKEYKSVHITAKKPISVTYYSTGGCSGGMYLCLPTNGLGTKYVISSYHDNPSGYGARVGDQGPSFAEPSRGYYMIIGTYNGTVVTITNSGITSTGSLAKKPYSITLNRGQCYMVRSRNQNESDDISGSIIESDKPVVVLAGHENAQIGDMSGSIEQRDFMIEQMIPYDYWDNTGFVVVPMADGFTGSIGAKGEDVRINVFKDTMNVKPNIQTDGTPITATSQINTYQTLQYGNVKYPSSFSSEKKMSVIQYDIANHGIGAPFPRPSMMTIVPRSRWRNAYLWSVPAEYGLGADESYITIIGPKTTLDSIYISKNGQKDVLIDFAGLSKAAEYVTIPDHPDLKAVVYRLNTGSYYLRANFPFMAYSYGFRAAAFDGSLSNSNNDELYHSYATPLGMIFGLTDSAQMTINVDTLCTGWRICVTDRHVNGGITSAIIADDPYGDIFPYDETKRGPYQYYNTSFTPDLDPNNTREIIFDGLNSTVCFEVTIDNIGKDGYAPLFISDKAGNGKMIELFYKKAAVAYTPSPDVVTDFGIEYILDIKDSTFRFINQAASQKPYIIEEIDLVKKNPAFQILSYTPAKPLPFTLSPGDTLAIKVRYTYSDTGYFSDSLLLKTECFSTYWPIEGTVGTGLIVAADHDFGNVVVGPTFCTDTVSIWNAGKLPYILKSNFVLQGSKDFVIDTSRFRVGNRDYPLPIVIPPGGYVKFYVCYKPSDPDGADSAMIMWATDIEPPYSHLKKDYTFLRGRSFSQSVRELKLEELRIHPNPTPGEDITVNFGLDKPSDLSFAVYDMLGREVMRVPDTHYTEGNQSVVLDARKLSEGSYILQVTDGSASKSISFKVMK